MSNYSLKEALGTNFIEYSMAVNTDRAIPDAKTGLKPVARRILWGAYRDGFVASKPHVKAARIVGNVMASLHPHGDTSIYGALVRLSQDWVMRYPLIDWHGANGNIIGDGPAAMRYTETRLSKLSEDGMLQGLKKKNVPFMLTFDEAEEEPETLPAVFPNLLCNPNTGIGVALATGFACHNLNEVATAIYDYMDGKEPALPGPDFPTGGIVINKDDIPKIMATGKGSVKIRGKYKEEKNQIVFYEIPYGKTVEAIMEDIGTACENGDIPEITNVRDETNKKGIRIVIEYNKNADIGTLVNKLFAKTSLQSSFSYNQVALVDKSPKQLNLKDCIEIYVNHNLDCLIKETTYDLNKAQARLEIVEGLLKALEDIDNIIAMIKASENSAKAKENLIAKYNFTEPQAKAIVDMKLGRLAGLERIELAEEKAELEKTITDLNALLANKDLQLAEVRSRLEAIVAKYGDARRTELTQLAVTAKSKIIEAPAAEPEDCVVTISESRLIKRIPSKAYKAQRRGGVGIKNGDDVVKFTAKTSTADTLMIFSSDGKMHRLSVNNIPEGTNSSKGVPVSTLINLEDGEIPMAYASLYHDTTAKYVFFITKRGIIKKVKLEEFQSVKRAVKAIALREGDELAAVTFIEEEEMLLATKKGMMVRIKSTDMPTSSRTAQGVKGINVVDDDEVLTCLPIKHKTDLLAVVNVEGQGKQVSLGEFTIQNRGGKGIKYSSTPVAGIALVDADDKILVTGNRTSIVVSSTDLPELTRIATGNILIKDNTVVSVSKI